MSSDQLLVVVCALMVASFFPVYSDTLASDASKKRYSDKLKLVDEIDP